MIFVVCLDMATNECSVNNGGCDHLCLPRSHLHIAKTCVCGVGFRMDSSLKCAGK